MRRSPQVPVLVFLGLRHPAAAGRHPHRNNSSPEPFQSLFLAMGIHTGGPGAEPRSSRVFPTAGLAVVSTSPKSDRSLPANVLVLATAQAVSNRPALRASWQCFQIVLQIQNLLLSLEAAFMSCHALPLMPYLDVRGMHLGLHFDADREWNRIEVGQHSYAAAGVHMRESEPRPGRSLLRPACAGVRVRYASLRPPSGCARRSSAAHPAFEASRNSRFSSSNSLTCGTGTRWLRRK